MKPVKLEDIESLAESILESVDYDIFKEDLEERDIMWGIEQEVTALLESYGIPYNKDYVDEEK